MVNGRWVPPLGFQTPTIHSPWVGLCDGLPACAVVGAEVSARLEPHGIDDWFDEMLAEHGGQDLGGEWIRRPLGPGGEERRPSRTRLRGSDEKRPEHDNSGEPVALVGPPDRLWIDETARVDPYTVFDTTNGPIMVGPRAWIQPFTRVEGPSSVGMRRDPAFPREHPRCVSIGPNCRIGGEVEASIVHGHSNKYHEGFLGHAYVGEWVNLGAITSNSDLRNDYGEVSVPLQGDPVKTGQTKVGCFIGDHTRTGMGSMLNTGTSIGVMCNVLPAGPPLAQARPLVHGRHVRPGQPRLPARPDARDRPDGDGPPRQDIHRGRRAALSPALSSRPGIKRQQAFFPVHDHRADYWPVAQAAPLGFPAEVEVASR